MAARKKQKKASPTRALHLQRGDDHIVGVKSLHVLLIPDGDSWFAQAMEIDYAAYGDTVEAAKANFGRGLHLTICEHIKLHGTIDHLLKVAPPEAWHEYYKAPAEALKQAYNQVTSIQKIVDAKDGDSDMPPFPFDGIQYLQSAAA